MFPWFPNTTASRNPQVFQVFQVFQVSAHDAVERGAEPERPTEANWVSARSWRKSPGARSTRKTMKNRHLWT